MRIGILNHRFVLALLLGVADHLSIVMAQSPGAFTPTGAMTTPRFGHTATLLTDGKVLIAGGSGDDSDADFGFGGGRGRAASAELYDPATGTFTATGAMTKPRFGHTATLLANGKVLIAGGSSAELYDPSTGEFTATGDMTAGPSPLTATLLNNGKVLITGACSWLDDCLPRAALYDPSTGAFTVTGNMTASSYGQTATLLADGKVLIAAPAGGPGIASGELYDPSSGTFTHKGADLTWLNLHAASLLMNGTVLISGGAEMSTTGECLAGATLYDPAPGSFASGGYMSRCRYSHTSTLLPDGTVLIAGGDTVDCRPITGGIQCYPHSGTLIGAELYDPAIGSFSTTGDVMTPRYEHTATLLNNGQVLITGGVRYWPTGRVPATEVIAKAELYTPPSLVRAPALFSLSGDGQGQGAIQHADSYQLVSPGNPAAAREALIIYCTGLADGNVIPPQVAIGGSMAEVLWFGKTPGFVGLNQINVRVPSGIAPGPEVPVGLTYIGRPSNEVTIGVQ
jgi:hypothetical protein